MSEPLDKKELGHYQKRTEKKDNAEIIIEKPRKDDESDAIKIKTMREYDCEWGIEDYDYFMTK